jgi:hypothetical protein
MTTDDTRSPEVSFDDAMRAARQAYWAEVRSLAEDVIGEARDNATSGDWTDEDDLRTYIHESIDGHAWVIYTARAQMVFRGRSLPTARWSATCTNTWTRSTLIPTTLNRGKQR